MIAYARTLNNHANDGTPRHVARGRGRGRPPTRNVGGYSAKLKIWHLTAEELKKNSVPKGYDDLAIAAGRLKEVALMRDMSAEEVSGAIATAFEIEG